MSKHTPGPWVWTPESESIHGYSPEGEALVVVYELNTNEADARLIAAAPDLLTALEGLLEITDFHELYGSKTEAARAAIAKATGEHHD